MNELVHRMLRKLENGQMPTNLELQMLASAWERVKQLIPPDTSPNLLKEHL